MQSSCYIVIYADSHLHTCTYICRIIHSDTTIKTHDKDGRRREDAKRNEAGRRTQEDSFTIIFTSPFIARVRKGCSRFACERVLETEHKLHILTPLLWPSRCVFLVLLILGSTPSGFSRTPSVGCGLPYHNSSPTVWNSTGNYFLDSNSTELNNNSTPTRSPTGSLKSNV